MRSVEHVVATITLSHARRKLLTIYIVSPAGESSYSYVSSSTNVFSLLPYLVCGLIM
ncbi:hypothetical protein E2C01_099914 [Portunus trituberculatus]|uniref:P/Homo B domain-containing protein n=1 Tax=Portunus trituberculatus TaxID=210409 RepID=A0A5B7KG31_PORTR|nr:hypothetical protein [Portunus trituberculatus]